MRPRPDFSNAGPARDEALRAERRQRLLVDGVANPGGNLAGSLSTSSTLAVIEGGAIKSATIADVGALLGGGLPATSAGSVDFGTGAYSASTTFADATVTPTSHVAIMVRREDDEGEWDALTFQYFCEAGSLTVRCIANPGPVAGIRDFRYVVFPS